MPPLSLKPSPPNAASSPLAPPISRSLKGSVCPRRLPGGPRRFLLALRETMVAGAAEAAAGALQYLSAGRPPPPPGSRPLQVSPMLLMSAASSPAGGSGPGRAPAAAATAAAPQLRRASAPPAGGTRRGAQGGPEGTGSCSGPEAQPPGASAAPRPRQPSRRAEHTPGAGRRGAGPSSILTAASPSPAASQSPRRPQGLPAPLTWVCGRSRGAARSYCGGPRRGAGCSARLRSAAAALGPALGPAPPPAAAPPPPPVSRPFAVAAVTQRAGNGCGQGLWARPSARPAHPGPTTRAPAPGEPAAPLRENLSPGPLRPGNHTCSSRRTEDLGSFRTSLISHYFQVLIYLPNIYRAPILFQAPCQELSRYWCTKDRSRHFWSLSSIRRDGE